MALSFSVFNKFKAVDEVSAPMRKMQGSVSKFGSKSQDAFRRADKGASSFSKKLKSIAAIAATILSINAVVAGLTDAVTVGAQFEQTIANAAAKFGDSAARGTKNFKALEDAARQAGATTEFAATEAAAGLDFLAMAGFNVEQSIAALPAVIDLATSANLDLARATDIASDTLGAFGLQTKDTVQLQKNLARVNDVMAKTVTSANTNMEQLFETFVEAGPVAAGLGASIETVATLAGKLADSGVKASVAGTTLKNVFLRLAAATPEAQKQLDKLGVSLADGKGNFRDVFDILEDLNGSLSTLGEVERAAVLNDIFGKIPIAGVNILLKTGAGNLREFRDKLEGATGASQAMAAMMRATTQNQLKTFMSALESLKITVFFALNDVLVKTVSRFTDLIRIVEQWMTQNRDLIDNILVGLVTGITAVGVVISEMIRLTTDLLSVWGPAIGFVLAIVTAIKAWAIAQGILNVILAANPIGIFVVALAAVTLAIKAVVDNWDTLVQSFKDGLNFLKSGFLGTMEKVVGLLQKGAGFAKRFFGIGNDNDLQTRANTAQQTPISPNAALAATIREETTNRSKVDVDFKNVPAGVDITQDTAVPGVSLNTGFAGAF